MTSRQRRLVAPRWAVCVVVAASLAAAGGCRRGTGGSKESAKSRRGDALFLAAAPAFIPLVIEKDLDAMGIRRIYVAAAALANDGHITPLPPPPTPFARPVVVTVMGEPGAAAALPKTKGHALAERWASALAPLLTTARGWGEVAGVHLHLDPAPEQAEALAAAVTALKKALGGISISVTVRGTEAPASWKPLAGAADELLVFGFGRRPELGDRLVPEIPEETAKAMPMPFRLVVAPGGFGKTGDGTTWNGRRLYDGDIDALSEDRTLDFSFGQVLSSEAGTLYTFNPRPGMKPADPRLAADGGAARFQTLQFGEAVRFLGLASRWNAPNLEGRVFLVEGVPRDRHLVGFEAVRGLLTGQALDLRLSVVAEAAGSGPGWAEFSLRATNLSPTPTDLSHFNNWVQVRAEGGVLSALRLGDFDRFELLSSQAEGHRSVTFGRAVVARLFENLFAPGEVKEAGPMRISGAQPKVFLSWRLTAPDGRIADGPETEVTLVAPRPEPKPKSTPPLLRRR